MWTEAAIDYADISLGAEVNHREPPLGHSVSGTRSISELPEYDCGCLLAVVLEDFKVAT
jgi:hypothetical protein